MARGTMTVTLNAEMQVHAKQLTRLMKVPRGLKTIMRQLAAGTTVGAEDALDAVAECLAAACTADTTSPVRRKDREAGLALWYEIRKQTVAFVDWTDVTPPAYIEPDLSTLDAVEEYLSR